MDRDTTELMMSVEKKCKNIYTLDYEFCPAVKYWINRGRALLALVRYKITSAGNSEKIKLVAKRNGIADPSTQSQVTGLDDSATASACGA